jgi:hypothetical protein
MHTPVIEPASPATPAAYRVGNRPRYWLWRGLGAAAFAAVCVGAMLGDTVVGYLSGAVGAVLFGAFALYALRQGLRRGPRLTLDAEGVDAADLGVGVIPWRDIADVAWFGSRDAPMLGLVVADPAPYLARMPGWPRRMQRLLMAQGLPAFSVNLIGVDGDPTEVGPRTLAMWEQAVGVRSAAPGVDAAAD